MLYENYTCIDHKHKSAPILRLKWKLVTHARHDRTLPFDVKTVRGWREVIIPCVTRTLVELKAQCTVGQVRRLTPTRIPPPPPRTRGGVLQSLVIPE